MGTARTANTNQRRAWSYRIAEAYTRHLETDSLPAYKKGATVVGDQPLCRGAQVSRVEARNQNGYSMLPGK